MYPWEETAMEKSLCTKVRPEMGQHADWEGLPESPIRASLITVLVMSPLHSLPHFKSIFRSYFPIAPRTLNFLLNTIYLFHWPPLPWTHFHFDLVHFQKCSEVISMPWVVPNPSRGKCVGTAGLDHSRHSILEKNKLISALHLRCHLL